jgi:hypothetical protein
MLLHDEVVLFRPTVRSQVLLLLSVALFSYLSYFVLLTSPGNATAHDRIISIGIAVLFGLLALVSIAALSATYAVIIDKDGITFHYLFRFRKFKLLYIDIKSLIVRSQNIKTDFKKLKVSFYSGKRLIITDGEKKRRELNSFQITQFNLLLELLKSGTNLTVHVQQ